MFSQVCRRVPVAGSCILGCRNYPLLLTRSFRVSEVLVARGHWPSFCVHNNGLRSSVVRFPLLAIWSAGMGLHAIAEKLKRQSKDDF